MKYGDTLLQRSIPEWRLHNIEYGYIKQLIKEHTTAGRGKAVSIPGQGNDAERDFENKLYDVLVEEHERINLFVKFKSLEIRQQLKHLGIKVQQLESRSITIGGGAPRPSKSKRYGAIEQQAIRTGEEIRSLSRFIGAQRLAFTKLLKKYRKWTRSDSLEARFRGEVLSRPDSFTRTSLDECLDCWTEILQTTRAARYPNAKPKNHLSNAHLASLSPRPQTPSIPRERPAAVVGHFDRVIASGSEVDFDVAFADTPIGDLGSYNSYWIHPEQLVELQVVLLQHLRLYLPNAGLESSSEAVSPVTTRRSSLSREGGPVEKGKDFGLIVLDQLEDYAQQQNESILQASEDGFQKSFTRPAAAARWSIGDESIISLQLPSEDEESRVARLKKKHLGALLNIDRDFTPWRTPGVDTPADARSVALEWNDMTPDEVRNLLTNHREIQPLVAIFSKRTRFVGLSNSSLAGQWCVLDSHISVNRVSRDDLAGTDWVTGLGWEATAFPYAVLKVRQEGAVAVNIINILDKSHLTHKITNFSIISHALWECWKPRTMSPPPWLPDLTRDIRKVPEAVPPRQRKSSLALSRQHCNSTASETDRAWSSTAVETGESSATSVPSTPVESRDFDSARRPQRKRKSTRCNLPQQGHDEAKPRQADTGKIGATQQKQERYWNEYDFPEDSSEDDAFYIYYDPNAQSVFEKFFTKLVNLFQRNKNPVEDEESNRPLLTPVLPSDEENPSSPTDSESDDAAVKNPFWQNRAYGTALDNVNHSNNNNTPTTQPKAAFHALLTPGPPNTILTTPGLATIHSPPSYRLLITMLSLTASVVITVIIGTLAATGRRKQRGEVDAGVLFGVLASLGFAMVSALTGMRMGMSRERGGLEVGAPVWLVLGVVFVGVCVADGVLVGWVVV